MIFKKKTEEEMRAELHRLEQELAYLELKTIFAEQRRELKDKLRTTKKDVFGLKYEEPISLFNEVCEGFKGTGRDITKIFEGVNKTGQKKPTFQDFLNILF